MRNTAADGENRAWISARLLYTSAMLLQPNASLWVAGKGCDANMQQDAAPQHLPEDLLKHAAYARHAPCGHALNEALRFLECRCNNCDTIGFVDVAAKHRVSDDMKANVIQLECFF